MDLEEEGLVLIAAGAAKSVRTPKNPAYKTCLSCGHSVSENYCQNCGQKNDDMRRSLWLLVAETLGGVFSFESRMWRTWGALMRRPGKISREYADGARTRYSAPIRTYLVVSILFFTFLGLSNTHFLSFEVSPPNKEVAAAPQEGTDLSIPLNTTPQDEGTQTINLMDYNLKVRFFTRDSEIYKLSKEELEQFITTLRNSGLDGIEPELQKIGNNYYDPQQFFNTLLSNPKQFNSTFNTWLPRAMFFMVPFAMLLGWLFIRGPKALLIDHLIHAIYLQSALYIAVLFAVILSRIIPGDWLATSLLGIMIVYFMLSLKHMFGRGWVKTIWTTLVGGFLYSVILLFIMTGITFFAFANIAVVG